MYSEYILIAAFLLYSFLVFHEYWAVIYVSAYIIHMKSIHNYPGCYCKF